MCTSFVEVYLLVALLWSNNGTNYDGLFATYGNKEKTVNTIMYSAKQ